MVALSPVILAYAVAVVITNISVSIQQAVLLPILGAEFTVSLVLGDPAFNPSERDWPFLLWTMPVLVMILSTMGISIVLAVYLSPDMRSVLPDHSVLRSWEIDFAEIGFNREDALERLNLGYLWHTTWVLAYMFLPLKDAREIIEGRRPHLKREHPQPAWEAWVCRLLP